MPKFTATIRFSVALVIFVAAISKLQVAPAILRGESLLSNPWLLSSAIIVEFALATFALLAPLRSTWVVVSVFFIALTAFATWARLVNRECSCFGSLLPSGTSLPINIVVVTVMFWSRKQGGINRENVQSMENSPRTYDQRPVNLSVRLVVACAESLVAASISGTILYRSLKQQ